MSSPDPSSQIGVVIVPLASHKRVMACNTFPERVTPRLERPEKYAFIEHAERNGIYHAAKYGIVLNGATLYMVGMGPPSYPCTE